MEEKKMIRKCILSLMSFVVCMSISIQGVLATEEIQDVSLKTLEKIEDMIDVEEGCFELSQRDQSRIESMIGKESTNALKSFLEVFNQGVEDGEIEISDNGTIIDLEDDELNVQGGNITKKKTYWWGVRNYMSHSTASKYIASLDKITKTLGYTTSISIALGKYAGFCGQVTLKLACEIVGALGGSVYTYISSLKTRTKKVYKKLSSKNGLVVEFKIWAANDVYKQ